MKQANQLSNFSPGPVFRTMASERFSFFLIGKRGSGGYLFLGNSCKFTVEVRRGQYLSAFIAPVIRALVTEYLFLGFIAFVGSSK
jgi:hypothetical protein